LKRENLTRISAADATADAYESSVNMAAPGKKGRLFARRARRFFERSSGIRPEKAPFSPAERGADFRAPVAAHGLALPRAAEIDFLFNLSKSRRASSEAAPKNNFGGRSKRGAADEEKVRAERPLYARNQRLYLQS